MATKAAPNDDMSRSPLVRALRRLRFRSLSTSPSSSSSSPERPHKPLPRPPPHQHPHPQQQQVPHRSCESVSLPPYLAHLAERPYTSCVPVRFPEPEYAYTLSQQSLVPRTSIAALRPPSGANADRLPPRPPAFVSTAESSGSNVQPQEVPQSLKPGPITVNSSSSQKLAYPWELVPQRKEAPSSLDHRHVQPQSAGKENRTNIPSSSSLAKVETPPRRQPSSTTSPALGSLTPNGSQADPKQPPVKGQCWGKKKDGSRCTRKIKPHATSYIPPRAERGASAPPRLTQEASISVPLVVSSDEYSTRSPTAATKKQRSVTPSYQTTTTGSGPSDNLDEAYCYQHIAEAKKVRGFYHTYPSTEGSTENRVLFKYDDWLSTPDLSDHTQVLIQSCMSRALTDTDRAERGHLYIHELLACSTATHICLKVGRSTQVFRRIGEWDSQCRSKQPLLTAIYPAEQSQDLLPYKATPTVDGVQFSRRWEALVHLELAGLGKRLDQVCHDCGKRHREIFMIPRRLDHRDATSQKRPGGFDLAEKVIVKWLKFVQMLASSDLFDGDNLECNRLRRPLASRSIDE